MNHKRTADDEISNPQPPPQNPQKEYQNLSLKNIQLPAPANERRKLYIIF